MAAIATFNKTLEGHTNRVRCIAFSPDSKLIASASEDKTVRLWNIPKGDLYGELKGHENGVTSVAFSSYGKSIVTGSWDKTVRTWSVATQQQLKTLSGHFQWVSSVAWSSNGDLIASGSVDKTVILWEPGPGLIRRTLIGHTNGVTCVSFSKDTNKLLSADSNEDGPTGCTIIWDVNFGTILLKLDHPGGVYSACFSCDDQFILSACADGIARMFNITTFQDIKQFIGHTSVVISAAFSFDGTMMVSGSLDWCVRLWDVALNEQLQQLRSPNVFGHLNTVRSISFSRDGKYIAAGSCDSTVRLWNAPSYIQMKLSRIEELKMELEREKNLRQEQEQKYASEIAELQRTAKNDRELLQQKLCDIKQANSAFFIDSSDLTVYTSRLSGSNFGEVYRGKLGDRIVAVKKSQPGKIFEFIKEVVTARGILHENLVQYLGVCFGPEPFDLANAWIVCELCDKGDLHKRLCQTIALTEKENRRLLLDVAQGLLFLEENGIVHGDLAARNVLLVESYYGRLVAKVSGFGLYRVISVEDGFYVVDGKALPIAWCSPQVFKQLRTDHASDVWAFGVLMWEVYTCGAQPHYGKTNLQMIAHLFDPANYPFLPQPSSCVNTNNDNMWTLMNQCWIHDPIERIQFSAIVEKLKQLQIIFG